MFWSFIDCSKVLEVLHFCWSLTFYMDLSLEAIWIVCYHFRLVWANLHFEPCVGCIETVYRVTSVFFTSAFTIMPSAKRKLVISRPPMSPCGKLINYYKIIHIRHKLDVMRQTAWLVVNPIRADSCAFFFNYMVVIRASDSMTAST